MWPHDNTLTRVPVRTRCDQITEIIPSLGKRRLAVSSRSGGTRIGTIFFMKMRATAPLFLDRFIAKWWANKVGVEVCFWIKLTTSALHIFEACRGHNHPHLSLAHQIEAALQNCL